MPISRIAERPAVGDDIGSHGGTAGSVFFKNGLDDRFPPVAAGQIEIDVGPGVASLGKKSLEEQLLRNGIDRRDTKAVTHRRVRRRPASLHENVLSACHVYDILNDEKIPAETEFLDETKFVVELFANLFGHCAVATARTDESLFAQKTGLVVTGGDGVFGELVAQIFQRKLQSIRHTPGVFQQLGPVGEQLSHLLRAFQKAFSVSREQATGVVEVDVISQAGEGIGDEPPVALCCQWSVGGDGEQAVRFGEVKQMAIAPFFIPNEVTLNFDDDIFFSKNADEPEQFFFGEFGVAAVECLADGTFFVAGESDEAFGKFGQLLPRWRVRLFGD